MRYAGPSHTAAAHGAVRGVLEQSCRERRWQGSSKCVHEVLQGRDGWNLLIGCPGRTS